MGPGKLEEKALVFSMIDKASGRFIDIELMDPNDSEENSNQITAKWTRDMGQRLFWQW